MTTETLDEMYERPTMYDLQEYSDKDPFTKKKPKRTYRIWKILFILFIFFLLLVPQLATKVVNLDNKVVSGRPILSSICSLNFFCHIVREEGQENESICICPPLIAKWGE